MACQPPSRNQTYVFLTHVLCSQPSLSSSLEDWRGQPTPPRTHSLSESSAWPGTCKRRKNGSREVRGRRRERDKRRERGRKPERSCRSHSDRSSNLLQTSRKNR